MNDTRARRLSNLQWADDRIAISQNFHLFTISNPPNQPMSWHCVSEALTTVHAALTTVCATFTSLLADETTAERR